MKEFHADAHREGSQKINREDVPLAKGYCFIIIRVSSQCKRREGRREKSVCVLNRNWYFIFIFSIFWGVYRMYVYVCEWWHMITSGGGQKAISVLLRYGLFCWVLLLTPGKLVTSLGRRGMGEDGERCVSCLCFPSGCKSTGIKDVLLHLALHVFSGPHAYTASILCPEPSPYLCCCCREWFLLSLLFVCFVEGRHGRVVTQCACGDQRTIHGSWFSPAIT